MRFGNPRQAGEFQFLPFTAEKGSGIGAGIFSYLFLPVICCLSPLAAGRGSNEGGKKSGRRDHSVQIPEIFPALVVLPQEHLPFDEPAVFID